MSDQNKPADEDDLLRDLEEGGNGVDEPPEAAGSRGSVRAPPSSSGGRGG